jgi:hypothetical protein
MTLLNGQGDEVGKCVLRSYLAAPHESVVDAVDGSSTGT